MGYGKAKQTVDLGSAARVSLMRFAPETITVKVGDTVRWETRETFGAHTVTFAGSGEVPPWETSEPQPQGTPKVYNNVKAAERVGGPIHEGSGFYGSGRLVPPAAAGTHAYSLTFTKPGTYTYWCIIHVPQGMRGIVVVQ